MAKQLRAEGVTVTIQPLKKNIKQQIAALKKVIKADMSVRQTEEYIRVVNEGKSKGSQGFVEEEYPESYTRLVEHLERFFSQNIAIKRT